MADTHTASCGEPLQDKWIFLKKTQPMKDHTAAGFPEGLQPVGFTCWSTEKGRRKEQKEKNTLC